MKNTYQPEIDALRAIAVLSVIVFHAFPNWLPGGFVGVDIFFVISGFLITKIIFNELQDQQFSYWTFYQRRIRRIFPSLIVVLLVSSIIGWIVFTPAEYELFGTHLASSAGFVPNFRFWREAGYFDKEAITKPLLHLWSLGVEEQFYLLWPIILGISWKFLHPHISRVILLVSILLLSSLSFSYWTIGVDPTADFYSPFTRFWELGLGGLVALINREKLITLPPIAQQLVCSLGGLLLLIGITQLHEGLAFPGLWALIPCLGTACIIISLSTPSATTQTLLPLVTAPIRKSVILHLLQLKPMIWIGLISYPLYLWHWPLLSFARIIEGQIPSPSIRVYLLILSGLLATLCYQFLEKPIRKQRRVIWVYLLLGLMIGLLSFGIVLRKQDGFKNRHQAQMIANPQTMVVGEFRDSIKRPCHIVQQMPADLDCFEDVRDPVRYALLGDSKADALFYGLTSVSTSKGRWLLIDGVHPPPANKVANQTRMDDFKLKSEATFQLIQNDPQIQVVALVSALRGIFPLDPKTGLITSLGNSAESLDNFDQVITGLEKSGKAVLFVMDNPTFPDPTSCISGGLTSSAWLNHIFYRKANPNCEISYSDYLEGTKAYRQWIAQLVDRHPKMQVIDTAPLLCDTQKNICKTTENTSFLYSYSDHLSDYAAQKIGNLITPIADQAQTRLHNSSVFPLK